MSKCNRPAPPKKLLPDKNLWEVAVELEMVGLGFRSRNLQGLSMFPLLLTKLRLVFLLAVHEPTLVFGHFSLLWATEIVVTVSCVSCLDRPPCDARALIITL